MMVVNKFQLQLQSLMETLSSTEPHYIRCVKPNNLLKPAIFENFNIIHQLRCGVSSQLQTHYALCIAHLFQQAFQYLKSFSFLFLFSCLQGVLEAIRISCAGYPTRRTFYEFLHRFGVLAPEILEGKQVFYDLKHALLAYLPVLNYA